MKSDLVQYLNNKRIALLGNAKSILETEKDFSNYQIVIRMNDSNPKGKEKYIGDKTNILVLSTPLSKETIKEFNAKYVFWATPKNRSKIEYDFCYDLKDWEKLFNTLRGNRPSTGCMIFDYLINHIDFESLDLFGFDFWETPTWYTGDIRTGPHNQDFEKAYINKEIEKNRRIKINHG